MNMWLVRAVRWVRNPPSPARVKLMLAIFAICLAIWGLEQLFGFPDWLRVNNMRAPGRVSDL